MSRAAVQLTVAGQTYQVTSNAAEDELQRLAEAVEAKLHHVTPPGRRPSDKSLFLAAITLAHELEEARAELRAERQRHREVLQALLGRVDAVLDESPVPEEASVKAVRRSNETEISGEGLEPL